eukprot:TRINITY_DN2215_c3_g1_i1.p1 TRINITY_DN2215_c3_g1~~TRINITY_DN2215_c3_g1_i1.p1  ORF type:complete len:255 (+),score=54.28 TRINITY_DN2215_c3_g1_i1:31-795(+)
MRKTRKRKKYDDHVDNNIPLKKRKLLNNQLKQNEGDFLTFIYIPVLPNIVDRENDKMFNDIKLVRKIIEEDEEASNNNEDEDNNEVFNIIPDDQIHISLSKSNILKENEIKSFIKRLTKRISRFKTFVIDFKNLKCYSNASKSKHFIGMSGGVIKNISYESESEDEESDEEDDEDRTILKELLLSINKLLKFYHLEQYYKELDIHLSVLWSKSKEDTEDMLSKNKPKININSCLLVQEICCKIGCSIYCIKLEE